MRVLWWKTILVCAMKVKASIGLAAVRSLRGASSTDLDFFERFE